jgi:hypothetical protein
MRWAASLKLVLKRVDMQKPPYIIYCNQAMDVYAALGIEKLRIEKRQAWQNYVPKFCAN